MPHKKQNTAVIDLPATDSPSPATPDQIDMFPGHDTMLVDIADIDRQNNHRHLATVDAQKIRELADSIKAAGLMQPIRVYRRPEADQAEGKHAYVLGYGYRRTAAVELLGRTQILAQVCKTAPAWVIQQARAMENLARQDLNQLEEMTAIVQLVSACDGDIDVAAGKLGRTRKWVQDRLYLDRLSPEVRRQVAAGEINLAYAREIAKLVDHRAQEDVANAWSHRQLYRGTPDHVFKGDVQRRMRSLRGTTWQLEMPIAGKPACSSCPHNSANDLELFERDTKDTSTASCASADCYGVKTKEGEKLMAKALKAVAGDVQEDGKLSLPIARSKSPEGLRPEMVISEVRRVASPAQHAAGGSTALRAARNETPEQKRERLARVKFDTAKDEHETSIFTAFEKAAKKEPLRMLCLLAFDQTELLGWNSKKALAESADVPEILRILKNTDELYLPEFGVLVGQNLSGWIMGEIADRLQQAEIFNDICTAWGIEVPPEPQLEDFLPKPTPASQVSSKPTRKGKMAAAGDGLNDDAEGGEL